MRLALVGWGGDSGVGRELISACENLPVECAFILENKTKGTRKDLLQHIPCFFSRPERGTMTRQMELFIEAHRPDTVLTWELPGDWKFPEVWRANKVAWYHMVHWDWFEGPLRLPIWRMANLISPNRMCQRLLRETLNLDSHLLPVPIDTDRFRFRQRHRADLFMSVYGYGGAHDRRSLGELLDAWIQMARPPSLVIRAQCTPREFEGRAIPQQVITRTANLLEPQELYAEGDVAVQVSRYEGVGVSFLEAQACGVPVIAVDAPPMNEIVFGPLVPVERTVSLTQCGKSLTSHVPSVKGIRTAVEKLAGTDISKLSRNVSKRVERDFSWNALRRKWLTLLSGCRRR